MKIAFVNSRIEGKHDLPYGLLQIAACVENIAEVRVFDPSPNIHYHEDVVYWKPDIIALSSMTTNYPRTREIIRELKQFLPNAKYIIGGIHATLYADEVLKETDVDAVCVGEGERFIRDFVTKFFFPSKIIECKLIENIDELLFPAYHLMPQIEDYLDYHIKCRGIIVKEGFINIMTSRGCFGKCIYCSSHNIFGRKIRQHSVDYVIREIEEQFSRFGKKAISFTDDTLTVNRKWIFEFCRRIKPMNVRWTCQTRIDGLTEDLMQAMKDSGCMQIDVGVESGSDKVLQILKKGITREQYLKGFALAHKVGLRILGSFIIGTPGETEEDIELTKSFLRIAKPDHALFFFMIPFPKTEVWDIANEQNLWVSQEYRKNSGQEYPLIADKISPERLVEIRKEMYAISYWRNIKGFLNWTSLLYFARLFFKAPVKFFKRWIETRCLYDAVYVLITNERDKKDI